VSADPVFTSDQLSYQDTNSDITAITGDDQLIVQNQSNLQISFSAAQALKYASISSYQVIFNGATTSYSSPGTYSLGAVNSSQNLELQVKVIDSRGNFAAISKPVTVLDWTPPIINAEAGRINNFESETNLTPNVQISSVNGLNAITLLQYRAKKTSTTVWGSWIDISNSKTQIVLDNIYAWDLEIQCSDKFSGSPSVSALTVPKGMPIMFFDTEKLSIGVNCFPENSESFEVGGGTVLNGEKMIFESGTWVPNIASRSGTNPTNIVQYRYGYYKRFNDLCFVTFYGKWNIWECLQCNEKTIYLK
jgi:hypothetical protein